MSWWNAKYANNNGEYEITFASKHYEKAKAVEKVCCAVIDKAVKSPLDVEVVVRCRECVLHGNCVTENAFVLAGIKNPFCCAGKRKEGAD